MFELLKQWYKDAWKDEIECKMDEIIKTMADATESLQKSRARVRELEQELETLKSHDNTEFVFDFVKTNAYSIERNTVEGLTQTVIGYFVATGDTVETREWYLQCSIEQHNKLAEEFKKVISP